MTDRAASRLRYAAAFAAGVAMSMAFAPLGLATLAIAGLAVVFYLVATSQGGGAMRLGYCFALPFVGFGLYWIFVTINRYGGGPVPAAIATTMFVVLLALIPMLALGLGWWLGGRRRLWTASFTLPFAWVAVEWVRSWLFTGATWLALGYSQIDRPVAAWAPIGGMLGVSLVTALLSGALAGVAMRPQRGTLIWASVMIAVYAASGFLDRLNWTQPDGDARAFAMIQGNVPPDEKWREDRRRETLRYYSERSREHFGKPLVIWPETAVPAFYPVVRDDWLQPLAAEAGDAGTAIITGVPMVDDQRNAYNAVMVLGQPQGAYRKRHLVPFGEYVPFRGWLGGLLDIVGAPLGDFTPGRHATLLEAGGLRFGTSVCYEVTFGGQVADTVPDADVLLNVSNDGWFDDSSAPYQHLEIARMRARETGREMLRSTNTGITAVIGADGTVRQRAPMFERAVLTGNIQPRSGATPYAQWEDWPVISVVFAGMAGALVVRRRPATRRPRHASGA